MDFSKPSRIILTCNKRLATILEGEVRELGFTPDRVFATGVEMTGTLNDCIKLNLNLRSASQVHYSLRQLKVNNPDDVYMAVTKYPWEEILTPDGYFTVTSHVDHFTVNNPLFVNVKIASFAKSKTVNAK